MTVAILTLMLVLQTPNIPPLQSKDVNRDWVALSSGMVLIDMDVAWVLYSATIVLCHNSHKKLDKEVVFVVEYGGPKISCFRVDPRPVGYYLEDPTRGRTDIEFHPLTKRTYKKE